MIEPAANEPTPTPDTPAAPEQKNSPAERRIAQLFAQKQEAIERSQQLANQNQTLNTQLLQLQEQVNQLQVANVPSPLDTPDIPSVAQPSGSVDVEQIVKRAAEEVAGRFEKKDQQREQATLLRTAQMHNFNQAAAEFPDLANTESQLFQIADQLMRTEPGLATNPKGPYLAACIARGVLADQTSVPTPQQKAAASGGPVTGPVGDVTPASAEEVKTLEAQIESATDDLKRGAVDPAQGWALLRNLKIKHGKLTGANVGKLPEAF